MASASRKKNIAKNVIIRTTRGTVKLLTSGADYSTATNPYVCLELNYLLKDAKRLESPRQKGLIFD